VVALAGIRLARDGDTLAEGTGLGGLWMGAILVAAATSLPELTTGVNAVLQGHPSLAAGDLFGACMANMMILAVSDLVTRGPRMLTRVTVNQALVGAVGISLTVIAALGILLDSGHTAIVLGWPTLAIAFTYTAGMRLLHVNREAPPFRTEAQVEKVAPTPTQLRTGLVGFVVSAAAIIVAAPTLASSAAQLGEQFGVSEGFAGMIFLAITTTLPEAAVTLGAIRIGAYSLAVGNLLGSNCFNIAVLVPLDLVFGRGSLMAALDPTLVIAALFATLLMGLAVLEALNKSEKRIWLLEPGPTFMLLTYAVGLVAVYRAGAP